jgi:hypothetical protein
MRFTSYSTRLSLFFQVAAERQEKACSALGGDQAVVIGMKEVTVPERVS